MMDMDAQGTSTAKEQRPLTEGELQHILDNHLTITVDGDTLRIVYKACPCGPTPCHLPLNASFLNCRKPPCA
jgi:hypothetical protein